MSPWIQLFLWFASTTTKCKGIPNGNTNSVEKQKGKKAMFSSLYFLPIFLKIYLCSTTKPNGEQLIFVLSLDTWFSIRDNEWVRNLVWTSRWLIHYTHQKQGEWLGPRCTDKKRQEHHDTPQVFEVLLKTDYLKKCLDVVSLVWLKQYI